MKTKRCVTALFAVITAVLVPCVQANGSAVVAGNRLAEGKRLLLQAENSFSSATSVRINGYVKEGRTISELDLSTLSSGDGSYVSTTGAALLHTILVGGHAYYYANTEYLNLGGAPASEVAAEANTWVEGGNLWANDLAHTFSFGANLKGLARFGGSPTPIGNRRVEGVASSGIRSSLGTLFVSRSAPRYPVEIQLHYQGYREVLHFSGWNTQAEPTAPPSTTKKGVDWSPTWSGYVVPTTFGSTSEVSAEWTVPTAACATTPSATSSAWIGIDGQENGQVLQVGTETDCDAGTQADFAWFENYPSPVKVRSYSVRGGDSIHAELRQVRPGYWSYSLTDVTIDHVWQSSSPIAYSGPDTSVEWIVEDPGNAQYSLTDFGSVTFSGLTVNGSTPAMNALDNGLDMFQLGRYVTEVSQYASDSGSFGVYYQ